ncbi:MAG: NAD(P)-dependent alcohol dehydrogenase [Dermatophilaceae bacterium]|nr:NAD(P)-dependent alcohol dehydrogenase [Intrasporangiaceae bacterium]
MRAAVHERYGPPEVVTIREVEPPTVGAGDVLVRIHSAAVTAADSRIRAARFPRGFGPFARLAFGVRRPRRPVLGSCLSGVVEAVGKNVTAFAVGDEVCGMAGTRMGAHAELASVPAGRLVAKPDQVSHDEAAGVLFGGTTAWHFLRVKSAVKEKDRVLVVGASGAVGSNAVQLAAIAGARVTAVTSGRNADLARDLGASEVVDYTTTDLIALTDRFDIVVDTIGTLTARTGRPLLAPGGALLLIAADLRGTVTARGNVRAGVAAERTEDMTALLGLVEAGTLRVVLDEVLPLDDIAEAYRRVDSGHKVGNVIIRPQGGPDPAVTPPAEKEDRIS